MKNRLSPQLILIIIAVTALTVLAVYGGGILNPGGEDDAVVLPMPTQEPLPEPTDTVSVNRAEVTPETVQAVIGTLSRADSYARLLRVELFWDGGESSSLVSVYAKGALFRVNVSGPGGEENCLIRGSDFWLWYDDPDEYYHGALGDDGGTAADEFQQILTYEEILGIPSDSITGADYVEYAGEPCIFAEYETGELGFITQVYISVETGLLMGAVKLDGDTVIYRMKSELTDISTPDDEMFDLSSSVS